MWSLWVPEGALCSVPDLYLLLAGEFYDTSEFEHLFLGLEGYDFRVVADTW